MIDTLFNEESSTKTVKPLFYDIHSENGVPVFENGEIVISSGSKALKSWAERALIVNRFKHTMYSFNHGSEFENLIGKTYNKRIINAEAERYARECVMTNEYITGIEDFKIEFVNTTLYVSFTINTDYGKEGVSVVL